ncbi:hypothetical protein CUMW_084030 [Citrus unshiu]|nr:hypothetical protein CUMW_084030 [Citrus unshiu]
MYDVFLSFRGEDTRDNFTSHLYSALCQNNVETFIDNDLKRGDEIPESLLGTIEASTISIIIFSEKYASSKWCLDELLKILECKRNYGQIVIPVFYRVDPSHVRKQIGSFGDSFFMLEERFPYKMRNWRSALTEAADLSGFDSCVIRPESRLVAEIANEVLERLDDTFQSESKDLIGVEWRIKEIESLLRTGSAGVYKLGIWGIGGIGKTTIAGAVFNKISRHFEGSYFACNVRAAEETGRLDDLRKELLSKLLNDRNVKNFQNISVNFQSKRLARKKVLIVFDDVNDPRQIELLIGRLDRFASGSQVIITTRDKQVLTNCEVDHIYQVKELVHADAHKLFTQCAFRGDHLDAGYTELAHKVLKYARGVPLVLKVLGRSLCGRSKEEWESAMRKLEIVPHMEIQEVLKISYDSLDDSQKTMHDLLREIVRKESIDDPGKRSRLWHDEDIYEVLKKNTGTEAIKDISLNMSDNEKEIFARTFSTMGHLKAYESREIKDVMSDLEVVPFPEVYAKNLVSLKMWDGKVKERWDDVQKMHVECDRLDSHARAYWNHTDLKQLRLKLAEVRYLLQDAVRCGADQNLNIDTWFKDLRGLTYDVDELIDDWEQSEISKSMFDREIRRIHQQLVRVLNLFHKLAPGDYEESSAVSELSSRRSDDYAVSENDLAVSERDLVHFINKVDYELLRDVNMVRILPISGMSGTGRTVLAQRVYSNKKVKSHFPFRFWFSVSKNLDLSTVLNAIAVQFSEIRSAENMADLSERLLVVLDDVCGIDDEELHNFRLLISNMRDSGSCFLVTTHSHRVATMMSSVSEGQLISLLKLDSEGHFKSELAPSVGAAQSPVLEHGENLRLMTPESLVMTEPQRHSTSGCKAVINSDLSGCSVVLSESVPASDTDSMSFLFEDPASRLENLKEDQMKYSPQPDKQAIPKGKDQTNPILNICVKQLVEPIPVIKLGTGNVTAVNYTKRNVRKIFRYVNDVTASKIGVYGVGGIGKTAALKALISYPEVKVMFHVIIWVTVSRYWNTRKIQKQVLRQLSLHRQDRETDAQVAEKLWQVLNGEKFLLLLDDVWEQIDLEAVGIPVPGSENGSKIFMASRELDVCRNMDVNMVVKLETLSMKDAWELFCKEVGGIIQSPDIHLYARAIVKGCCGVPLLTIVTAKALAGERNVSVWKHASRKFSLPITIEECCTEDLIELLKFSFDQLKDHDVKSCFLHCSLFPEDREVSIIEFIDYCIQEGIIVGTLANAHKRGHQIVDVLVDASLLLINEVHNSIRMPGLMKDLAFGILSSSAGDRCFLSTAEGFQFLSRAYSRSAELPNAGTSSLRSPERSRLFIPEAYQFLLGARAGLTEPPSEEEWTHAKMIFFMDSDLQTLPGRPSCPNLLTLFLQRNCRLRVIPPSFFELMTSLKVLNLSKTRIKSLPATLVNLKCLQILILRDCDFLFVLPPEVGSLECLEVLDLRGTEIKMLPKEIGKLTSLRYLTVFFFGSMYKNHHVSIVSLSDFSVSYMTGLKFCIISECLKIKTVVDTKEHTTAVFPSLENLTLNHLWDLTCIWEGIVPEGSFAELRILSVHACQHLEYVFTSSMIQFLAKLEELTVEYCPAVKSIILDGESTDSSGIMLPGLKKLRLHHLPELVDIWRNEWPSLEYISFYGCPKLKKIGMDSKLKDTVIWIKAEKKWWAELEWNDTELPIHLEDRLSMFSEDDDDEEPSFFT